MANNSVRGFKGGPVGVEPRSNTKGTGSSNGSGFKGQACGPKPVPAPSGKGKNNSTKGFLGSAIGVQPTNK